MSVKTTTITYLWNLKIDAHEPADNRKTDAQN